jgi:hypothetical protein
MKFKAGHMDAGTAPHGGFSDLAHVARYFGHPGKCKGTTDRGEGEKLGRLAVGQTVQIVTGSHPRHGQSAVAVTRIA